MKPHLVDSGTFISPVDKVNEKSALSQVPNFFILGGFEKKPALILVPNEPSQEPTNNHRRESFEYELQFNPQRLSTDTSHQVFDNVRSTLRSPPPEVANLRQAARRKRMLIYIGALCGFILWLAFILILATL